MVAAVALTPTVGLVPLAGHVKTGGVRVAYGSVIPATVLPVPVGLNSPAVSVIGVPLVHNESTNALPTTVTTPVPAISTFGQAVVAPAPSAKSGTGVVFNSV